MLDFFGKFSSVSIQLSNLFEYKFIPNKRGNSTFIGNALRQILSQNNSGNLRARDFELNRLIFLIKHLENLKRNDLQLFKDYIKELKKQDGQDPYWGSRFEICIASSLIDKNISFRKDFRNHESSPDFIIDKLINIECSSVRLRKSSNKTNFDYKISSLINKKSKKDYNNSSTALFIDFTNILYNLLLKKTKIDTEEIKSNTYKSLQLARFGSVLIFMQIQTHNRIANHYLRIDNREIDPKLRAFLDKFYRINSQYIHHIGTTFES